MPDPQPTPPPELNEGGRMGIIVLLFFLVGLPLAGVIFTILHKKH